MNSTQTPAAKPLPRMSTPAYDPKVGDQITVELPDERTRATIENVVSPVAVLARLNHFTTARGSHNYRKGDLVPCKFEVLSMNVPGWRAVSQRELDESVPAPEPEKKKRKKS